MLWPYILEGQRFIYMVNTVDGIQILEPISQTFFKILDRNVLPNKELPIRIWVTVQILYIIVTQSLK